MLVHGGGYPRQAGVGGATPRQLRGGGGGSRVRTEIGGGGGEVTGGPGYPEVRGGSAH